MGSLDDRPWRIAGKLTPGQFHCATVGAGEALEAAGRTNARHWREHSAEANTACLIKSGDTKINILGGYRFPDAPVVDLTPPAPARATGVVCTIPIGDDGSIPEFLRRAQTGGAR